MNTHSSRLEGFSDLVDLFLTSVANGQKIPYMAEKVHILLTGKKGAIDYRRVRRIHSILWFSSLALFWVLHALKQIYIYWNYFNTNKAIVQVKMYQLNDILDIDCYMFM